MQPQGPKKSRPPPIVCGNAFPLRFLCAQPARAPKHRSARIVKGTSYRVIFPAAKIYAPAQGTAFQREPATFILQL